MVNAKTAERRKKQQEKDEALDEAREPINYAAKEDASPDFKQ